MPLDGWVWLKSRMCRGLLHGHVCGVWGLKSGENWRYGIYIYLKSLSSALALAVELQTVSVYTSDNAKFSLHMLSQWLHPFMLTNGEQLLILSSRVRIQRIQRGSL